MRAAVFVLEICEDLLRRAAIPPSEHNATLSHLSVDDGSAPDGMARLDEHAQSVKAALPPLKHKPSEYVLSGRYFRSIEIPEGAQLTMTKKVIELLGEDILMYASDYPHGKSWFPKSVDCLVMGSPGDRQA